MQGGATQAMSVYIVEERQHSRCPRAAGTRRAHGGCGRYLRCSSSTMCTDIASSSRLDLASQAPCARPLVLSGWASRARQELRCTFCCWPPGPLARRERGAYPLWYSPSEQQSQRACGPQPKGARHLLRCRSSTMHTGIACVAAPCSWLPGARAKMHIVFLDGPLVRKNIMTVCESR